MTIRIILLGAMAFFVSAASASAQGKAAKPVVMSQTVMKSMLANKPKTKTQLGAKVGIGRKPSVDAAPPTKAAPTSVKSVRLITGKE